VVTTTLEGLLRMTVPIGPGCVAPEDTQMTPDFRIAVQEIDSGGVRVIIHSSGHDSDTLDFIVIGNKLLTLEQHERRKILIESRVILQSALSIASREGKDTNWSAFGNRLRVTLESQSKQLKEILPDG